MGCISEVEMERCKYCNQYHYRLSWKRCKEHLQAITEGLPELLSKAGKEVTPEMLPVHVSLSEDAQHEMAELIMAVKQAFDAAYTNAEFFIEGERDPDSEAMDLIEALDKRGYLIVRKEDLDGNTT